MKTFKKKLNELYDPWWDEFWYKIELNPVYFAKEIIKLIEKRIKERKQS